MVPIQQKYSKTKSLNAEVEGKKLQKNQIFNGGGLSSSAGWEGARAVQTKNAGQVRKAQGSYKSSLGRLFVQ